MTETMILVQEDKTADAGPSDEFESKFSVVLDRAAGLGGLVHDYVTARHPGPLDQMPESTVWRLHLTATASYLASIQCLRTRRSSLGGYILLRGPLEAWSHLDFIAGGTRDGSSALRALRYEAGAIREWGDTAIDVPGGHPVKGH